MKSKKRHIILILIPLLFILNIIPSFAAEEAIPSIDIDVILKNDGSAIITETWDVSDVYDGTEYYRSLNDMKGMSVHSFLVWDESGIQYKTLERWDVDLTLEEKSGTCGILTTSDGYELCWGIGSYGDHQYTIQYTITGLVKDYGDYAGFYHQFISELSSPPEAVSVKIQLTDTPLTADNTRIWGYGFSGETEIGDDGNLNVFSHEKLDNGDYVNVLCRFDKELFSGIVKADKSFEELQKSAENNSSDGILYILAVIGIIIVLTVILAVFYSSRYRLADGTTVRLPKKKKIETNWSIPFGGSIPAVYSGMNLLRKRISYEQLMGAYLICWQGADYIRIEERKAKEEAIIFNLEKAPDKEVERILYNILIKQADSNGILWTSRIEKHAEDLYKKLTKWAGKVQKEGERELIYLNAAAVDKKGIVRFTGPGFEKAVKILGFQKYLMEMESQSEYSTDPRGLWRDYLIFAALFNIGEQVLKSMKEIDSEYFDTFSGLYGCNAYSLIYLMTMTNHISSASVPDTSGTGGGTSSFGGGGFSGGGGGGSR